MQTFTSSGTTGRKRTRHVARGTGLALLMAVLLQTVGTVGIAGSAQAVDLVPKPVFSQPHGFYSSPFSLTLTATEGSSIRFTTNGATPTATSGTEYSTPIEITGTTPVRAVAYRSAGASEVVAKTYIFLAGVRTQGNSPSGYPSVFAANDGDGPYPADYAMDPEVVNHPNYTGKVDNALKAIPSVSITTDIKNLFDPATGVYYNPNEKGSAWERPISLEWIDPAGGQGFSTNGGIRMHGQASRRPYSTPKKSMRIYFKASYGNGKLDFPLFDSNGEDFAPVSTFDRLILRNGGNRSYPYWDRDQRRDADYANDEWAREAFLDMGGLSPHGTYVHLYINGMYWGLYDTTERIDEKFYASYLGGNPDTDYDVIAADEDQGNQPVADPGDLTAFNEVFALVSGSSAVSSSTYQTLSTKVDLVNFADYMVLTNYIGKTDWPNHNWDMYRKRTGADTRLKFATWDNDSGLWKVDENNTLADDSSLPKTPAHLFLRLTTNPEFRQLLADRVQLHVLNGGALSPAACADRYSALTDEIDQAIIGESARWGDYSRDVYQSKHEGHDKAGPAYLYSRDLTDAQADPGNLVADNVQNNWTEVRAAKLATYCPQRAGVFIDQYKANGWYADSVKAPSLSKYGGAVSAGYHLTITNPNASNAGDILYTTDGTDPRAAGGSTAAGAVNGGDSADVTVDASTQVRARVKNGTTWSNLIDYTFTVGGEPPPPPPDNVAPTTTITAPAGGSNATVGTAVTIAADAGDADGSVAQVVFKANGAAITSCTDTTAPYTCSWTPSAAGPVSLTSTATDDEGSSTTSSPVSVTVTGVVDPPPPAGTGDFLESGGQVVFEAESFASKTARSAHDWAPQTTPSGFSGASVMASTPNNKTSITKNIPTTSPVMNYPLKFTQTGTYTVWVRGRGPTGSDDSAHVGVNNAVTSSPSVTSGAYGWKKTGTISVPAAGTRTFNAWMREDGALLDKFLLTRSSSTPTGIGPAESARDGGAPPSNVLPTVELTAPANSSDVTLGDVVTIKADAADSDGSINRVEFKANGTSISGCVDIDAPFSCEFTPLSVGPYTLSAVATDDRGGTSASASRSITVSPEDGPPPPPPPAGGTYKEAGGVLAMEIERGTITSVGAKTWSPTTTPTGFAGTGGLVSGPNAGVTISSNPATTSPSATLSMDVGSAGTYTVWVRAAGPTGSDDSIYLGADNVPGASVAVTGTSWIWKKAGTVNLTAGMHSFSTWMREDGALVDRVLLTKATTTPTGAGPAESNRVP